MSTSIIRKSSGFTLVELAIVMMIVALLIGTALIGATEFIQRARFAQAKADLKMAADAILGFAYQNGRLPCADVTNFPPTTADDTGDGLEDDDGGSPATCTPAPIAGAPILGYLPAATLGVEARDPWGTAYFYRVTDDLADEVESNPGDPASFTIALADTGDMTIQDEDGDNVAQQVPVIIFSVGPNRSVTLADAPPLEDENLNGDPIYVKAIYAAGGADQFDDVIEWISINTLKAKMVEAGVLP